MIGLASPTFVGMAVGTLLGVAFSSSSEYGQFLYTLSVNSFNCFSSGMGSTVSAPLMVLPMYG